MEPKKILITGGLWYIGSHTAVLFSQAGYEVVLLDNLSNTHKDEVLSSLKILTNKDLPFYEGDVRDYDFLDQLFEKEHFDWVIHFAAKKAVGESCHDPFLYYDNNINGTITLLEIMDRHDVRNLIFSSSATVYDAEKNIPPFTETDRLNTTNPYGTTKLVMEFLLKDMAQHKNFTVFWDDYPTPDGTCIRDYIHIEDLAQAHLQSFEYIYHKKEIRENSEEEIKTPSFEVFNIWTWSWKSVKEMLSIAETVVWEPINFEIGERRDWDVASSVANPIKAKQVLWWEPKKTIVEAVEDAWNFYNNHNEGNN